MGDHAILRDDFGGGIYRGRKAPINSLFDASNALVDDEGQLFRRGGSAYLSTVNTVSTISGMADVIVGPGLIRTLTWGNFVDGINALDTAAGVWRKIYAQAAVPRSRAVPIGSIVALSEYTNPASQAIYYAGSLKLAGYATSTITVTNASTVVTGAGTAFLANVDAGMFMDTAGAKNQIVASVTSDTQLNLMKPYPGPTVAGASYSLARTGGSGLSVAQLPSRPTSLVLAAVGTPARLIWCYTNRAYFSEPDDLRIVETNYHELPGADVITGADAFGDTLVLFTTRGVWFVENMSLDPVDDYGNVQQQVRHVSDLILWGDAGIARFGTSLVVPAIDDVYLFAPDASAQPISGSRFRGDGGIRPLYRAYVAAGYEPGTAVVHRGHLFLPISTPGYGTLIDVLVCRLDRGFAWTRWAGHAAGMAYATRVGSTTRSPKLLGISGVRVTDLTACLNATGAAQDADATTPTFTVDSNDDDLGPGIRPNTAEKIRYVYETTGGTPTFTVSSAVGPEGAAFTAATLKRGGGASDGTDWSAWRVGRKAERIRFRFTTTSAVTSLILRRREVTVRQAGQT